MSKSLDWASCDSFVKCTKCGSDLMVWCDVPIKKTGTYKRETKCLLCGDRQTTKMAPPQLPAPEADGPRGLDRLRQWHEEVGERTARGEHPAPKPKKGRAQAPAAAPDAPSAAQAEEAEAAAFAAADAAARAHWESKRAGEQAWVLDIPAAMARCPECAKDAMEVVNRRSVAGKKYRWQLRCTACGVPRIELTSRDAAASAPAPAPTSDAGWEGTCELCGQDSEYADAPCDECQDIVEADAAMVVMKEETEQEAAARRSKEKRDARREKYQPTPGVIELLTLNWIHEDSIQPRTQLDLLAAGDYARDMFVGENGHIVNEQGQEWPPLVGFREPRGPVGIWLADGHHRCKAARQAGLHSFQAEIRPGGKREALLYAVGANVRNGVRFGNADKRRAVSLLFDDVVLREKTDTEIALLCRVSQPFVSKMRQERRERDQPAEQVKREDEEPRERPERSDNGYGEEREPAPLQFDLVESIAAKQRRLAEEEEEAAERRAEAEKKRIEQEQRDSWSTPPEFLGSIVRPILETIDLDAASNAQAQEVVQATRWFSAEDDALSQEWEGNVWLNPPYSHPLVERFALKAIEEFKSGRVTQLLVLVNSSTSSLWWHRLAKDCAVLAFPLGRLSFWSPHGLEGDANRNASTLFYFGNRDLFVKQHLRDAGYIAVISPNY